VPVTKRKLGTLQPVINTIMEGDWTSLASQLHPAKPSL
jgi:hypothetical protein